MWNKADALSAILRTNLHAFIRKTFEELEPGAEFFDNWHIRSIAYHLTLFAQKRIKRLIILVPPRSLKSLCGSVALPAWLLGYNPAARIICTSYSEILASRFGRDTERVMTSTWYRKIFPASKICRATEREIELYGGGNRFTSSVGGTLRGIGAGWIIIDDPIKGEDSMSGSELSSVINWYRNTLYTRLDNKKEDGICLIMQRIHVDDLAGYLIEQGDWTVLSLPAIAPEDTDIPVSEEETYHRKANELLHPEREDESVLAEAKVNLGSAAFSAQYLQAPVPPEGNYIKREWFKTYDKRLRDWFDLTVQSWDTASAVGENNSYSVCLTFGIKGERYYLLHVLRERMDFPTLKRSVDRHARRWGADHVLIERAASGFHLLDELHQTTRLPLVAIPPDRDKRARLARVSADIEVGRVYLPEEAPWLAEFLTEVLAFPSGKFSDQVDALTHFLYWAKKRNPRLHEVRWYGIGETGGVRDRYYERTGRGVFD